MPISADVQRQEAIKPHRRQARARAVFGRQSPNARDGGGIRFGFAVARLLGSCQPPQADHALTVWTGLTASRHPFETARFLHCVPCSSAPLARRVPRSAPAWLIRRRF